MVVNIKFRKELRKMLESQPAEDDIEIINYVLEYAFEQYPRPLMFWLLRKMAKWDWFRGEY